jgi:hypothetical protein
LIVRGLVFVGVPAAILVPIYLAAWVLGWFRVARTARSVAAEAGRSGLAAARRIVQATWTKRLVVLLAAAVLPAAAYGSVRLQTGLDASGLSNMSAGSIRYVYLTLINYSAHDPTAQTAFLIALGWVSTLALASVVGATATRNLLAFVLGLVAVVVGILGALALLVEIVLILEVVAHIYTSGPANPSLVVLGWTAVCGLAVAASSWVLLAAFT